MRYLLSIGVVVVVLSVQAVSVFAQETVSLGSGSYASYVPLSESRSSLHGGCQAYQTEHRRLYLPDSLLARLGSADGTQEGTLALPSNDWWTYALVNRWTGKLWFYPGWAEAKETGLQIGYPSYWEPTGCEVKWNEPLGITFTNVQTGRKAAFKEALVDAWSDFMMSFIMQDGDSWVRVTCMHGSPLVWIETNGITANVSNPEPARFAVYSRPDITAVALLADGLSEETVAPYAFRIPRKTRMDYAYDARTSSLTTTFRVWTQEGKTNLLMGFLPHHYYSDKSCMEGGGSTYMTPRGSMHLAQGGNDFYFTYRVHAMLPFFPAPMEWADGYSAERMKTLNADYAQRGTFGADTYWGGKGLTQMMHYMTFALQTDDQETYRLAKKRLRDALEDWYTYTPGEPNRYFARYPKWGAMVGMDSSYDSDTFNDHHFHYGYFIYASAVLCMLDSDFRDKYGAMAREVAMDYACWLRDSNRYPFFRTFDPYCGHSFAGGMGNEGNGNGQESSSEAMQSWGGLWMLGAALGDEEMLNAGILGYTLEAKATAEYWFDRKRRNIDYSKYQHPYCCNLTMQGVGWWTWFSGDPVWMHSIQWLPVSPLLTNYLSEDLDFARWDYAQMYAAKEIGNYEADKNGLGDESGLGNVCLSYLALFDADSAARVWDRMDVMGKPLAKNPDTGGITYWLAHTHRSIGEKRFDIFSDCPLACAYTDTLTGRTVYAVYNCAAAPRTVHFFGAADTTVTAPAAALTLFCGTQTRTVTPPADPVEQYETDPMAWDLPYPNLALHKPVSVSSFENAGCVAVNLTDGDSKTRWGSAHKDNEYAVVDLGGMCYIDHLVLRWEAAYASRYEIALSDDGSVWRSAVLASGGGVETVALAPLASRLDGCRGRYIRITGIERATPYGTSLYELEAYGRPLQGEEGVLFALSLAASETVVRQGQTVVLTVLGYDTSGHTVPVTPTLAVTSGNAVLEGNTLHCNTYGTVEVSAVQEDVKASLSLVVLESEQAVGTVIEPAEVTLPVGDEQRFTVSVVNQFGEASSSCFFDFLAVATGDTVLRFECSDRTAQAVAHVQPFGEVNLALGKYAEASGAEGDGTAAVKAVDGDMATRWSSRFMDGEWIAVDLQACYRLSRLVLYWEAAYATAFDIEISDDGVNYRTVKSVTGAKGGVQELDIRTGNDPVEAQFVRVVCLTRNTGYGASLWELEVYGEGRCGTQQTAVGNITVPQAGVRKFIRNNHLYIEHNGAVYTVTGNKVCHE